MSSRRRDRSGLGAAARVAWQTCRRRRVRCDGTRPSCNNCRVRRFDCPGYTVWDLNVDLPSRARSQQTNDTRVAAKTETPYEDLPEPQSNGATMDDTGLATSTLTLCKAMSSPLWNAHIITDEARHAFAYFQHRLRTKFHERHYPVEWMTLSITFALQEPAVFFAAAALSIVEQTVTHTIHTTLDRPFDELNKHSAIRLYSKAIACLRQPVRRAIGGMAPLEPLILSCLLFTIYEVYAGNSLNAVRHARVGRAILDGRIGLLSNQKLSLPTTMTSDKTNGLISNVKVEHKSDYAYASGSGLWSDIRSYMCFELLEEARSSLETLTEAVQSLREALFAQARDIVGRLTEVESNNGRFCLGHTLSRFMPMKDSEEEQMSLLINAFASWGTKFGAMYASGDFVSKDLFMSQIRFFNANFTLAMCRAASERIADYFADQFTRTLDCAERLLRRVTVTPQTQCGDNSSRPIAVELMQKLIISRRSYSAGLDGEMEVPDYVQDPILQEEMEAEAVGVFDFGVLPALFTIACKCRTSRVRRRAVQLLSNIKRSEALYNSDTLAIYADAIVCLEEQRTSQILSTAEDGISIYADEVLDAARFLDVVASPKGEGDGSFILHCTSHAQVGNDIRLLEYEYRPKTGGHRLVHDRLIRLHEVFE